MIIWVLTAAQRRHCEMHELNSSVSVHRIKCFKHIGYQNVSMNLRFLYRIFSGRDSNDFTCVYFACIRILRVISSTKFSGINYHTHHALFVFAHYRLMYPLFTAGCRQSRQIDVVGKRAWHDTKWQPKLSGLVALNIFSLI